MKKMFGTKVDYLLDDLKREFAELRKMVEYQQFILEMCKKIDMSAKELICEYVGMNPVEFIQENKEVQQEW